MLLTDVLPKYTVILDTREDHERRLRIEAIELRIRELETEKSRLMGFEGKSGREEAIKRLTADKKHLEMALAGYPELLSLDFLSMTSGLQRFPQFMVLTTSSNEFTMEIERHSVGFMPQLPDGITKHYKRTIDHIRWLITKDWYPYASVTLRARFEGEMSDEDREAVMKAQQSRLFANLYVIAEAPVWDVKKVAKVKKDPVVIGWVSSTNQAYIVRVFQPTEKEHYVLTQNTKTA